MRSLVISATSGVQLRNFHVLSKLLLEQEYMETMHCSLQGAGSVFHTTLRCERETICTNLMMKAINAWWTYIVTITTTLYGPASA